MDPRPHKALHTAAFLDITPYIDGTTTPPQDPISKLPMIQVTLPLKPGEVWRARVLPMITAGYDDPRGWSYVREGTHVRVPLLPYRVQHELPELSMGLMDLAQGLVESWPAALHTHIVVGTPLQDLEAEGTKHYRIWVGFAVRTE
jgi:hypothetical protein